MPKAGIRYIFNFYGRIFLASGGGLLVSLTILALLKLGLNWKTPLDINDLYTFAAGFIVIAVGIGPYVATVGQLRQIQRAANVNVQTAPPMSKQRRQIWLGVSGGAVLALVVALFVVGSVGLWLTFGVLAGLLGAALLYISWRVGQIEKAANMIIYAQDYSWRFDKRSYFGVIQPAKKPSPQTKL